MNIAVLLGGTSAERHVSMASGKGVAEALLERGHTVRAYDPALGERAEVSINELELPSTVAPTPEELAGFNLRDVITAIQALPEDLDLVFIALHGVPGEDGTIQALLELRGLTYTGSGILASALAMNKAKSKQLFEYGGILTPKWFSVGLDEAPAEEDLRGMVREITDYPVVVKPNDGGSTVGLSVVAEGDSLLDAFNLARSYGREVLFEEFIEGRELTVAVIDGEALPVVEIRPKSGIYDYHNKYTPGRTEYFCPADLPMAVSEELKTLALRAHELLGCSGYSRVDFRLDAEDNAYCLEVNTLPGMTGTSLVPKAARAAGIEYDALCERIAETALRSKRVAA